MPEERDEYLEGIANRRKDDIDEGLQRIKEEGPGPVIPVEQPLKQFGWVQLEIMGHRTRVGRAMEDRVAGTIVLRIDMPVQGDGAPTYVTEYYGGGAIYCMAPITEERARDLLKFEEPRPPHPAGYRPTGQHMIDFDDGEGEDPLGEDPY